MKPTNYLIFPGFSSRYTFGYTPVFFDCLTVARLAFSCTYPKAVVSMKGKR